MIALIDHEEVLDRVAFPWATVIGPLILGILHTMDRSRRTSMQKKGDVSTFYAYLVARRVAHSSAVQAGSQAWWAHARFRTVWRR
jgi:hypothetical protein